MVRYEKHLKKKNLWKTFFIVATLIWFASGAEVEAAETNIDFTVYQYDTAYNRWNQLKDVQAAVIKDKPLKLNIQGIFGNSLPVGSDIRVEFDVVSYSSYTAPSTNKLIKEYIQTEETKSHLLEFNRDFFITTKERGSEHVDDTANTLYLESFTQNYQVRVKIYANGDLYGQKEFPLSVIGEDGVSQELPGGPNTDPNAEISAFLTGPNSIDLPTKRLQVTARELNSKEGLAVNLEGYIKKSWVNNDVLVRYELRALNSYTDYINGNGITRSLSQDPNAQPEDQSHVLVAPMNEWIGKDVQDDFLKRYQATAYTQNNYESFEKKLILRTKLEKSTYPNDASSLFLDNLARDYELTVTVSNVTTGEVIREKIELDVTTVKTAQNAVPVFGAGSNVTSPTSGANYDEGNIIPIKVKPATDADHRSGQTEYLYYKVYYSYTPKNADGTNGAEVKKYIARYENIPSKVGEISVDWKVDLPKEVADIRIIAIACDTNHVCSNPTVSSDFKLNAKAPTIGVSASISINPKPTGEWQSKNQEVYVTYEGPAPLLEGAVKKYVITNSMDIPTVFTNTLGTDNKIIISAEGEKYVHVKYTFVDGSEVYVASGPYKIYKSALSDFTMQLVDTSGQLVTDWTKEDLKLRINYSGNESTEGLRKQYRIDQYHVEWQELTADTIISLEGNRTIYGRVVNKAGEASPQKVINSKIDKSVPTFNKVNLKENESGKFEANVFAIDSLSGIVDVKVNTGSILKLSNANNHYELNNLTTKPTSVTVTDKAGNKETTAFGVIPKVTFAAPYKLSDPIYRNTVKVTVSDGTNMTYMLGNRLNACLGTSCTFDISTNILLKAISQDGIKESSKEVRIANIDKSELRLLLEGKRDKNDGTKINFSWNYNLPTGSLYCMESGVQKTYTISGAGAILAAKNQTYDCHLSAIYGGELLKSNRVIIYPDSMLPVEGGGAIDEFNVDANIYIQETRLGTSYIVNSNANNFKGEYIPIPVNDITKN